MLSNGISLASATEPGENAPGDEVNYSAGSADSLRAGLPRDVRSAKFTMSDFPALDGRASISMHSIAREPQPSFDMTATFSREETSQTFNSLSYEQMAMENDLMSRPILTSQTPSTASFAIQPEDFPALPGTHLHENLIINESDASTLQRAPVEGLQSVKLPRVAHSDFQPLRPPTNPLDDKTAAHSVPGHISKVQVDLAKQAASVRSLL